MVIKKIFWLQSREADFQYLAEEKYCCLNQGQDVEGSCLEGIKEIGTEWSDCKISGDFWQV